MSAEGNLPSQCAEQEGEDVLLVLLKVPFVGKSLAVSASTKCQASELSGGFWPKRVGSAESCSLVEGKSELAGGGTAKQLTANMYTCNCDVRQRRLRLTCRIRNFVKIAELR